MNSDNRDAIDFGKEKIPVLFAKLFFPTLLGMLASSLMNVADGIFVGKGVGSDALAAINIAAPIYMVSTGLGLLFGSGASVVAAVHLSHGDLKAARINITQAFSVSLMLMAFIVSLVMSFPETASKMFGSNDKLVPLVVDYLIYVVPGLMFTVMFCMGMFIIRLDGSPVYAMLCNVIPSVLNFILDYIFVFPLHMGIVGAALATLMAQGVGGLMAVVYFLHFAKKLSFYKIKISRKAISLTLRNIGYMAKIGVSSLVGELAISALMIMGNFMFMKYLKEDGVAAFSVACYTIPMVFMVSNAVAASLQPIASYNYGISDTNRICQVLKLSVCVSLACGILMCLLGAMASSVVVGLFIDMNEAANTYNIASTGYPYYALSFIPLSVNIILIGFLQSIENAKAATAFTLERGFIVILPAVAVLPALFGVKGLWLAQPASEMITLLSIVTYMYVKKVI